METMPRQPQQPVAARRNITPADRPRPLREQLHEAVNANIAQTVKQGIEGVDQLKARGLRELERRGLTGMSEVCDSAADLVKKLLIRGISK
jgi:hypothetical protein